MRQRYRLSSAGFHPPLPCHHQSRDRYCLPLNKVRWKVDSIFTYSIVLGAGRGFHSLLSFAPCSTDVSSFPSTIPQLDCRAHKSMTMLWQEMSGVRAKREKESFTLSHFSLSDCSRCLAHRKESFALTQYMQSWLSSASELLTPQAFPVHEHTRVDAEGSNTSSCHGASLPAVLGSHQQPQLLLPRQQSGKRESLLLPMKYHLNKKNKTKPYGC